MPEETLDAMETDPGLVLGVVVGLAHEMLNKTTTTNPIYGEQSISYTGAAFQIPLAICRVC
jgi:hypothetical protein